MNPTILRILDANANRAREALRVIEDYARFGLNDDQVCGSLKQLRHDLAAAVAPLLRETILHRDTPGDVGTSTKTASELKREGIADVVTAAGKRLGEALRTIEEFSKPIDPPAAATVEAIRYRFYALEQQIARTLRRPNQRMTAVRLYVIISQFLCKQDWLETARLSIEGGADCIQLREKEMESGELLSRARRLVALCHEHHVPCIINDRPDIAVLSGADGVHVGQGDLPAAEARKMVGMDRIVGVSTHNLEQAQQAVRDGADYIGIGPVFRSATKPRNFLPGLDFARAIAAAGLPIPAIAIAGITPSNVDEVKAAGIPAVAVSSAIIAAPAPRAAAARFKRALPAVGQTFLSVSDAPPVGQTFLSVPPPVGQTFLSVPHSRHPFLPVPSSDLDVDRRRRHLPHWTQSNATYFVTFRVKAGILSMPERLAVLEHVKAGSDVYYRLLSAVIMPDHGHALLEPIAPYTLDRVMKGIKGVSAKIVNQMRNATGSIWQDESFDRIVRDHAEFEEKLNYIVNNAPKKDLVADPWDYPALFVSFESNR
jgi:thiamine-phosphate pyrophosphorylase